MMGLTSAVILVMRLDRVHNKDKVRVQFNIACMSLRIYLYMYVGHCKECIW